MKAYLVGFFQISDVARYRAEYVKPALALIAKHGGKPLIVADECMSKEGRLPDGRFVVIEFPDMQIKPVRQALTQSILAFVQGVDLPR